MTPFTLREPEPRDARELAELHVATWRETYSHLLPADFFDDAHLEGRRRMWDRLLGEPREGWRTRIAERDGRIVGFAMAGPSTGAEGVELPRGRQLYMLYLSASDHGRGAGQALFDAVLGDEPAQLWVARDNPRAIAFYRRNGFEFDGVTETYPDVPQLVDARMVR
jgi:ribosomal protein S18 acetylase RimI-like enzyme